MELRAHNADELYRLVLVNIIGMGRPVSPRGDKTLELIGTTLVLDNPHHNIITIPERKLSYHFMVAEWLWMMSGSNELDMIRPYNRNIANFSDDGETLRGAYGPKLIEQLPYVLEVLREDPSSRQAVITLWRERPRASKDIPCTIMFQFFLRERALGAYVLDMTTYMRSNDAWWGLPYDLFSFTMLQQYVAGKLDAMVGKYVHMVGSLHLYERYLEAATELTKLPEEHFRPRDYVTENMRPLPPMPAAFKAMVVGLAQLGPQAQAPDELKAWLSMNGNMGSPWDEMLSLLGHKFHKDRELVMNPWKRLLP